MSDRDIAYSDRDVIETAHDVLGESKRLKNDVSLIQKDFDNFKKILNNEENSRETIYDKSKLGEIAKCVLDLTSSKISNDYLISLLDDIYSYMDIDSFHLYAKCYDVASSVLFKADFDMTSYNYANTILQEIKKQPFSLNEAQKTIAKGRFGEKYTQVLSYKFPLSERGLCLSIAWKKLSLKYPEIFKSTVIEETQVIELFNICNILKKVSDLFDEYCKEEYLRWLANEIYDKCWSVYNIKQCEEHENVILKLQNDYANRKADYIQNNKTIFEKTYSYLYNKELKEIEEIKRLSAERMERYRLEAEAKTRMQMQYAIQRAKEREATNSKEVKQKISKNIEPKPNRRFDAATLSIVSCLSILCLSIDAFSWYEEDSGASWLLILLFYCVPSVLFFINRNKQNPVIKIVLSCIMTLFVVLGIMIATAEEAYDFSGEAVFFFFVLMISTIAMFVLSIITLFKTKWNMDFYYNSMKYREKCYKKVANMKEYLDKGIISEEEFENNKKEILKNIKM